MIRRIKNFLNPKTNHGITWIGYGLLIIGFSLSQVVSSGNLAGMVPGHGTPAKAPAWLPNNTPLPPPSAAVRAAPSVKPNLNAWYVHNVIVHYQNGSSFDISGYVNQEGDKYGVSPIFIAAVMGTESGMTVDVQRWAGGLDNSCGLMQQILANVAARIGNSNAWADCQWEMNPYNSIAFGTEILAQDIAYHGNRVLPPQAYVMYNAGAGWPDSFYFYPTGMAATNYYDNFLPNWNYAWAHYASYSAPVTKPTPKPSPKPAPVFHLKHWNEWRWFHRKPLISPWWHHHLGWAASIWRYHQKLGGVRSTHWWKARGKRGYTRTRFAHGAILTWPSDQAVKIEWGAHPALAGETPQEACAATGTECLRMLTNHINADRARHGAGPLTFSWPASRGNASCIGAFGHARHMAAMEQISHDQFPSDVCFPWASVAENVGEAGGSKEQAILADLAQMLSEPWTPGCTNDHACNLRNPAYHHLAAGLARGADGNWFISEELAS